MIPRDKEAPSVTGWNQYVCTYCFSVRDCVAIGSKFAESFWKSSFSQPGLEPPSTLSSLLSVDTALAAEDVVNNCRQIHFSPLSPFIISHCFSLAESNWSPADK